MAKALGSLLPEDGRVDLSAESDRISIPAPGGPATLMEAMWRLRSADIELADVALRRPSLDDVFLALTKDSAVPSAPEHSVTVS
jgi:ABC-2 type transport system ATP-binding protein